ncbi:MAG TPA: hypothetical protein ENJ95_14075 [Bacteroidetes bacterium]|nr:hypothetical protein [Bacteroidota bacterium]
MTNIFNPDFQDFIKAFNNNDVDYILLGGYAVIIHGYNRTTGDMDVWVRKSRENYLKIVAAFREFGMPIFDMTEDKFLNNPFTDVFTFGVPPVSIDLMTDAKALDFEEAYKKSELHDLDGLRVRVVHVNDLIYSKSIIGRSKDLNDIKHLKKKN